MANMTPRRGRNTRARTNAFAIVLTLFLTLGATLNSSAFAAPAAPGTSSAAHLQWAQPKITDRATDDAKILRARHTVSAKLEGARTDIELYLLTTAEAVPDPANRWCIDLIADSRLPYNSLVLVLSTATQTSTYCFGANTRLNQSQMRTIDSAVIAEAAKGDFDSAGLAFAQAVSEVMPAGSGTGGAHTDPAPDSAEATKNLANQGSGSWSSWLFGPILAIIIPLLAFFGIAAGRRRQRDRRMVANRTQVKPGINVPASDLSDAEAVAQVDLEVIRADDALRQLSEELDFATAQFGDATVAELQGGMDGIRRERDSLFQALQNYNSARPAQSDVAQMDPAQVTALAASARPIIVSSRQLLERIQGIGVQLESTRQNLSTLADRAKALEERIAALRQSRPVAQTELNRLSTSYAHIDLSSVLDNIDQADGLLTTADASLAEVTAALEAERNSDANSALIIAERAYTQANTLIKAIFEAEETLQHLDRVLLEAINEVAADRADMQQLGGQLGEERADLTRLDADAEAAIALADAARAGSADPLATLERLRTLHQDIDSVLAPLRENAQRRSQTAAHLGERLAYLRLRRTQLDTYIQANRGAIGPAARTTLAEVSRRIDAAQAQLDQGQNEAVMAQISEIEALLSKTQAAASADVSGFGPRPPMDGIDMMFDIARVASLGRLGGFNRGGYGGPVIGSVPGVFMPMPRGQQQDSTSASSWSGSSWGSDSWGGGFSGPSFGGGSFGSGGSSWSGSSWGKN